MAYPCKRCSSIFIILHLLCTCTLYTNGCYTSIICFGDSLSDTGNLKHITSTPFPYFYPPYGETFFHKPTGRASNGRLIVDFIGFVKNIPFFNGNGKKPKELGQGVNYAVIGSSALDSAILEARGVHNFVTNASLRVQLEWFRKSICANISDCSHLIEDSLIFISQTGMNDYLDALSAGKSISEVGTYAPFVVEAIISSINELIELGAKTILVPGTLPMGCLAFILQLYHISDKTELLSIYHNELLVKELNKVRELHPDENVIYADIYNAAMQIYRYPNKYGR
ncbi:hypothetical protein LXL04_010315 [Taraxacum kok-saghyz]